MSVLAMKDLSSLDPKGGASEIYAGSLGGALLSQFIVIFDYPHNRIFFAPNTNIPPDTKGDS